MIICLMMMTVFLSGCIGGDIETSEGDDVVLEDTDDGVTLRTEIRYQF